MRRTRTIGVGVLVALLLVVGGLALGLRLFMGREAESRLRPDEEVVFERLASPLKSNVFVMCPPSRCGGAAGAESPVFNVPWERLRDYWREMIAMQPRVELAASDRERRHLAYVQRSAVFRFPDIVTVEFIALEGGRSSLAIHSSSRYGRADFGVNRARVMRWTDLLQHMMREGRPVPATST